MVINSLLPATAVREGHEAFLFRSANRAGRFFCFCFTTEAAKLEQRIGKETTVTIHVSSESSAGEWKEGNMAQYDDLDPESSDGPEALTTVSCKLFGDRVTERLCVLRRRELNARGGFTCEGCAMDVKKCHEHSRPMGSCESKR